jgi:hypothetical protein
MSLLMDKFWLDGGGLEGERYKDSKRQRKHGTGVISGLAVSGLRESWDKD